MTVATLKGTLILDTDASVLRRKVGRPSKDLAESDIRRLYVAEQLSLGKTAKALGCAVLTVRRRMDEYGIPVRKRGRPVLGARKLIGKVDLDPSVEESDEAKAALVALLEAEAVLAEAETAEGVAETVEAPTDEEE